MIPPLQPEGLWIPSMLIQPFVENAIKHGVMHLAGKKGLIHIRFVQEDRGLICSVADNGIGRQQSERINQNNRDDHRSSGIEITIHRLQLLHREQGSTFLYKVEDKTDTQGEPAGTTIIFSIPYKEKYEPDQSRYH